MPEKMRVEVAPDQEVTAVYGAAKPDLPDITLILGHGAGTDQTSGFMTKFATELAAHGVSTVTFNFLYTEQGRRVPDTNHTLEACFRAVVETTREKKIGRGTLVIGGKSMGGRVASQIAAARSPIVEGLVFLGYPLHPPGKVNQLRAKHLSAIKVPMLFVQGSRDPFGAPDELRPIIKTLEAPADLCVVAAADLRESIVETSRAGRQDKKDTSSS